VKIQFAHQTPGKYWKKCQIKVQQNFYITKLSKLVYSIWKFHDMIWDHVARYSLDYFGEHQTL